MCRCRLSISRSCSNWEEQQSGNTAGKLFGTVAMFGGTSIGMSTIFGLGIMPYISASIIFQLLASVVPSLEAMMKEGESGRKRINEYTRYATVRSARPKRVLGAVHDESTDECGTAPNTATSGTAWYASAS